MHRCRAVTGMEAAAHALFTRSRTHSVTVLQAPEEAAASGVPMPPPPPPPPPPPSWAGGTSGSPRSPAAEAGPVEGRRSLQGLLSGIFEAGPGQCSTLLDTSGPYRRTELGTVIG